MEFVIGERLFSFLGRVWLFLKYRSKERRLSVLGNKYAGSYADAGREYSIYSVAFLFGLALLGLLEAGVVSLFI